MTAADWAYARAKEVLLYLLLHRSATRGEIALEFWPDASLAEVRSRFSAILTHTRKALGRDVDWIPFADGRYTFNRTGAYWFDVEVFAAELKAAHQHLRQTPRQVPAAIACLESAVALYQGDFAADLKEGQWQQGKREALRQALADALLLLGRLQVEAERYDLAANVYRQVLTHDPYVEEAHRELLRCLARPGAPALALRQYETLERVLAELDVLPSPESLALAERLRRGERI